MKQKLALQLQLQLHPYEMCRKPNKTCSSDQTNDLQLHLPTYTKNPKPGLHTSSLHAFIPTSPHANFSNFWFWCPSPPSFFFVCLFLIIIIYTICFNRIFIVKNTAKKKFVLMIQYEYDKHLSLAIFFFL